MTLGKPPTACWNCAKATGGCSWSSRFEPVEGWTAQETLIKLNGGERYEPSFHVISCPEFDRDAYRGGNERCEVALAKDATGES